MRRRILDVAGFHCSFHNIIRFWTATSIVKVATADFNISHAHVPVIHKSKVCYAFVNV